MINTTLLQILVDQLRQLTKESKEMNQKIENQFDSIEDPMSEDELECLQEQFEDADLFDPEEDCSHASDELAVPTESVLRLSDNHCSTNFLAQTTLDSAVTMSPTDLVLFCSASAPTTQYNFPIDYKRHDIVNVLTLYLEFAQHAGACPSEFGTGYKLWKPGLHLA